MKFHGKVFRRGRHWIVELPDLDLMSQGYSRKEALSMIRDAVRAVADTDLDLEVLATARHRIEVSIADAGQATALLLRRQRQRAGLTLREVAERLHESSPNAYARYEQGVAVPSVVKLEQLLKALDPTKEIAIRFE